MCDREAHEELERCVAVLTEELKKTNCALEEKTRELAELSASYEALVQERTKNLEAVDGKLQEVGSLQWVFWAID
jgi:prefoldin subunit 5